MTEVYVLDGPYEGHYVDARLGKRWFYCTAPYANWKGPRPGVYYVLWNGQYVVERGRG